MASSQPSQVHSKTSADSAGQAIYAALDEQTPEIRVLELLPFGGKSSLVESRILTIRLDKPYEPYLAVSYNWSSKQPTAAIKVNEAYLKIPRKQRGILFALRSRVEPQSRVMIWLDLLCIDQTSVEDTNRQVSLMGQIFSGAAFVYA